MRECTSLTTDLCHSPKVVTIGKFDGLHLGHRSLIEKTVALRSEQEESLVISLESASSFLRTGPEKASILSSWGVDAALHLSLSADLITMPPEVFIEEILVRHLMAKAIVVGSDFRFGYKRGGDTKLLQAFADAYGYTVYVMPEVTVHNQKVSSSRIRSYMEEGRIDLANQMLGYAYFLTGEVVHGRALGRTIGVPTANIIPGPDKWIPRFGVYASCTQIGSDRFYGITNIGTKPTVEGGFVGCETYLFDMEEDLYGAYEKTELLSFLRPEEKFDSIDALKTQLLIDIENGRSVCYNF